MDEADKQRTQRNIDKAIAQAKFRYPGATLGEVIMADERKINMRQLKRIAAINWRTHPTNIHLFAPVGTGKTYLACALGLEACNHGFSVADRRLDEILDELAAFSSADEAYAERIKKHSTVDVLIIDDFLTLSISQRGQEDLTKIVRNRDGHLPTFIASQTRSSYWIQALPNRVCADTLVSRLSTGHQIDLGDYDIRQHLSSKNKEAFND